MSAAFLESIVAGNMPTLGAIVNNGECRLLARDDVEAVDDQGFPNPTRTARTAGFIACSWSIANDDRDSETIAASQPRAMIEYEITVPQMVDSVAIDAQADDICELKLTPGGTASSLEVTAVLNQANAAWLIKAIDTNAP